MKTQPSLGTIHTLVALAYHDHGMVLDGGPLGPILLPSRYVPKDFEPGDEIEVFLSNDSEDRLVATTDRPFATAGEFALLKVAGTSKVGAFLEWGLPKDLFLPFREQLARVKPGDYELVYIYVDEQTNRLVASARLGRFVSGRAPRSVEKGMEVSLIIAERTQLGYKAIVEGRYWGLIHATGALKLPKGHRCTGYIARIREDDLVDIALEKPGYERVTGAAEKLEQSLRAAPNGFLPVHDNSSPQEIQALAGMSKKLFKQAVGSLYRQEKIELREDGIRLKK